MSVSRETDKAGHPSQWLKRSTTKDPHELKAQDPSSPHSADSFPVSTDNIDRENPIDQWCTIRSRLLYERNTYKEENQTALLKPPPAGFCLNPLRLNPLIGSLTAVCSLLP